MTRWLSICNLAETEPRTNYLKWYILKKPKPTHLLPPFGSYPLPPPSPIPLSILEATLSSPIPQPIPTLSPSYYPLPRPIPLLPQWQRLPYPHPIFDGLNGFDCPLSLLRLSFPSPTLVNEFLPSWCHCSHCRLLPPTLKVGYLTIE